MKQKFLKDLGIDVETDELLQQFDLTGYMDQICDNRLKQEDEQINKLQGKSDKNNKK